MCAGGEDIGLYLRVDACTLSVKWASYYVL